MNKLLCLALVLLAAAAVAQESKPPDELEPGVNTSAPSSAPVAPPRHYPATGHTRRHVGQHAGRG